MKIVKESYIRIDFHILLSFSNLRIYFYLHKSTIDSFLMVEFNPMSQHLSFLSEKAIKKKITGSEKSESIVT